MQGDEGLQFFVVPTIVNPAQAEVLGEPFELRGIVGQQGFHYRKIGLLPVKPTFRTPREKSHN